MELVSSVASSDSESRRRSRRSCRASDCRAGEPRADATTRPTRTVLRGGGVGVPSNGSWDPNTSLLLANRCQAARPARPVRPDPPFFTQCRSQVKKKGSTVKKGGSGFQLLISFTQIRPQGQKRFSGLKTVRGSKGSRAKNVQG